MPNIFHQKQDIHRPDKVLDINNFREKRERGEGLRNKSEPGTLPGLVLPAAGLPEVSHGGELRIDGPAPEPKHKQGPMRVSS